MAVSSPVFPNVVLKENTATLPGAGIIAPTVRIGTDPNAPVLTTGEVTQVSPNDMSQVNGLAGTLFRTIAANKDILLLVGLAWLAVEFITDR